MVNFNSDIFQRSSQIHIERENLEGSNLFNDKEQVSSFENRDYGIKECVVAAKDIFFARDS